MEKSRILIIGATGNLGYHIAKASIESSHTTFAYVRDSAFNFEDKLDKLQTLSSAGVTILKGSLEDEHCLIAALKKVDVVICAVSSRDALGQKLLIQAIKQVVSIKKFIPSEFGTDPDKVQMSSDIGYSFYSNKAKIRRLIEAEGIPYTIISCNFFTSYLLPSLVQPDLETPPKDKITIYGDGNTEVVFVKESDVAALTISTVDDPRTLNKVVYLRPPGNVYSMNGLVELWEKKIGKELEKIHVSEEELLKKIIEMRDEDLLPRKLEWNLIFIYSAFVKGDQTYFDIGSSGGVDGVKLYPHVVYTTVSEYLDTLV